MLPAFDRAELLALGERWRNRREPDSIAFELGLPRYGIEQLAALDCIVPDGPGTPGTGPYFTDASVDAVVASLQKSQSLKDPVPLRQAMRVIGGRLKPWGPAFRLLLDGDMPFAMADGRRPVDGIMVPASEMARIAALEFEPVEAPGVAFADTMVQSDALEVLNAPIDFAHLLTDLPCCGQNPRMYQVTDVLARAAEIVTLTEIAARSSTHPAAALSALRRTGLIDTSPMPGAWPRRILQQLS